MSVIRATGMKSATSLRPTGSAAPGRRPVWLPMAFTAE